VGRDVTDETPELSPNCMGEPFQNTEMAVAQNATGDVGGASGQLRRTPGRRTRIRRTRIRRTDVSSLRARPKRNTPILAG
jgi:hypothetical protein